MINIFTDTIFIKFYHLMVLSKIDLKFIDCIILSIKFNK